jgi:hypothetical protein
MLRSEMIVTADSADVPGILERIEGWSMFEQRPILPYRWHFSRLEDFDASKFLLLKRGDLGIS